MFAQQCIRLSFRTWNRLPDLSCILVRLTEPRRFNVCANSKAMIRDTLGKIETRIQQAESLKPETKTELIGLLATLKREVGHLSETHSEEAQSITGFAQVSAHEATRGEKNPHLLKLSVDGLQKSVDGFEASHPKLVQIVNRICETLSGLGV